MKISSNHRKIFFKMVEVLPKGLGDKLYHWVQRVLYKGPKGFVAANKKSYDSIVEILEEQGATLEGKTVVEIGSGWRPAMPYFLKYFGNCGDVYTYDLNSHYQSRWIEDLNRFFRNQYNVFVDAEAGCLPSFVKYFPHTDLAKSSLPSDVNFVFSRFVLEHVPPADILSMHERLAEEVNAETFILHLISPSDHRAYTDRSLSLYDFLRYSQEEWDRIQTRFDYHNRLRLPQYLEIFETAGFEVVSVGFSKVGRNSEEYGKFKALVIHPDFEGYTEEEVLASAINVLLRKKGDK